MPLFLKIDCHDDMLESGLILKEVIDFCKDAKEDGERIRKETGMFTMPCGRINTPEVAEKILEDDKADLIVMARAQLADANFCNKAKNGQVNQIRYCSNSLYDPSIKHIT